MRRTNKKKKKKKMGNVRLNRLLNALVYIQQLKDRNWQRKLRIRNWQRKLRIMTQLYNVYKKLTSK